MKKIIKHRCHWVENCSDNYKKYHDEKWGKECHDDHELYRMLILESYQAGLSWICILNKFDGFDEAYDNFDIDKVCNFDQSKMEQLANNPKIVRNRLKIKASVNNSKIFKEIQKEYGSFDNYLYSFTDKKVIYEPYNIRTTSPLSDTISLDLQKRGMKFVGSTIIYSYLQAIGLINGHGKECDLYKEKGSI